LTAAATRHFGEIGGFMVPPIAVGLGDWPTDQPNGTWHAISTVSMFRELEWFIACRSAHAIRS